MTAPDDVATPSEPDHPAVGRRFFMEMEYWNMCDPNFQIRASVALHKRLTEWAARENKRDADLIIEILEEAIRRRGA